MRRVLVTGASKGIGRAIAIELSQQGFSIIVHYHRDLEGAQATQADISKLGHHSQLLQFDISDRACTKQTIEADIGAHGA